MTTISTNSELHTAFHEAAHTVVALAFEFEVVQTMLSPPEGGYGRTDIDPDEFLHNWDRALPWIMVQLAGFNGMVLPFGKLAAESTAGVMKLASGCEGDKDVPTVRATMSEVEGPHQIPDLIECFHRAGRIVDLLKDEITLVANALLFKKLLLRTEIDRLVEGRLLLKVEAVERVTFEASRG